MNRLALASSPYLRQHAENPVEWYEWGAEALQRAKDEDKPLLLSIGYSACHWCHVMAHECFENPEIAAMMNRDFVNIKVDREERPDLDDIYMQATLIYNQGSGGWPMTVFCLPDGRPIHAGTYFPPQDMRGMPGFPRIMAAVLHAYQTRRADLETAAEEVTAGLQRIAIGVDADGDDVDATTLAHALRGMLANFDPIHGGLSKGRPKFPNPMNVEFVLRQAVHNADPKALEAVIFTLKKMARGGIYDQLAGGFARYSVDERWLVPHFEKMLYDNAQLSRLYLHAWQATKDPFLKRIAVETYDYLLREMTSPEGGFYSTTDADSEGEEGKFFLWTVDEVRALLPAEQAEAALLYWDITAHGNFEERNILNVPQDDVAVAEKLGITPEQLAARLDEAKHTLYAARTQRIAPGLDDKILSSWNGLMLASLAEAARTLKRDDYAQAALRCADFLLGTMRHAGRLLHTYKDGKASIGGFLEDYANVCEGLIQAYQMGFEVKYLQATLDLAEVVLAHFATQDGGFFDTSDEAEQLIARPRNLQDNATPSGNSAFAKALLSLYALTGDNRFEAAARQIVGKVAAGMAQYPQAFGEACNAADMLVRGMDEVAIIGDFRTPATQTLIDVFSDRYRPCAVIAHAVSDQPLEVVPMLLAGRTLITGQPAAYVCRHFVCQLPITEPDKLAALLNRDPR